MQLVHFTLCQCSCLSNEAETSSVVVLLVVVVVFVVSRDSVIAASYNCDYQKD